MTDAPTTTGAAEQPRPYVPEDPDDLRDGLFKGFWAHRKAQESAEE